MAGAATAGGPMRMRASGPVANDLGQTDPISDTFNAGPMPVIWGERKLAASLLLSAEPRASFLGIVIRVVAQGEEEGEIYEILLRRHVGMGEDTLLGRHGESDAIAAWRAASQAYQLPLMAEREDGKSVVVESKLGCVTLGATRIRRRTAAMARRRPRFLMRRKPACLPIRPVIHRSR